MTDSQVKYQAYQEDMRHNLMLENLGKQEQESKRMQSEASMLQAQAATSQAESSRQQAAAALQNAKSKELEAQASMLQAETRSKELELSKSKLGWDIGWHFASFLFPDANTALKSGAQVVSALFG